MLACGSLNIGTSDGKTFLLSLVDYPSSLFKVALDIAKRSFFGYGGNCTCLINLRRTEKFFGILMYLALALA